MTEDKTYNGWSNYETWNVKLWLDNDETTYKTITNMVYRNKNKELYVIANKIKAYVEALPDIDNVLQKASVAADLLNAALSEVDWLEIAEAYHEE